MWERSAQRSHVCHALRVRAERPFLANFVQEDEEWKLIHGHTSIGVRNEEMFGEDITASS